ncbi:hypothetical protein D3C87_1174200 [compost metagenome]
MRPQLDRHGFGALVEVERGDVGRVVEPGQQAPFTQPRQHPMGEGGEAVDVGDHLLFAGPQARAQVRVERHAAPGLAHAGHQFERHLSRCFRQCRRNARGVQMPGLEQVRHDRVRRQVTGRRTTAEVLDHRVAAIVGARLELKPGGVRGVDVDVAAIQAFFLQCVNHKPTQRIGADAAQPCHVETQTRQANGDVAVGAGNAFVEGVDAGQVAGLLGDEHRHGLAEREDIDLRHERSPAAFGRGGRGR